MMAIAKGDRVSINGVEYVVTGSTADSTEEEKIAGRRMARTLMERAGIPPITEELLSVEPYSDDELDAIG
jgi:hypothetical protein